MYDMKSSNNVCLAYLYCNFRTHDELGVVRQQPGFVVRKTSLIDASHDAIDKRCARHGERKSSAETTVKMAVNKGIVMCRARLGSKAPAWARLDPARALSNTEPGPC
jgi:hypothetical protein